jgi:hypothetical protein
LVVSTAFTLNAFVGVFVTCTPVPMLNCLLAVVEFGCAVPAGRGCAFAVSAVVLSSPPHATTANELKATRRTPHVNLRDLIRDICSLSLVGRDRQDTPNAR